MHIERVRQIDSSEPDESGMCEYYFEYDIYRFTDGPLCFVARSYTDEPDRAHFLRIDENGNRRALTDSDLSHPLFLLALAHLRNEGKANLSWLSGRGNVYEPV
jgi:hypothetical protein